MVRYRSGDQVACVLAMHSADIWWPIWAWSGAWKVLNALTVWELEADKWSQVKIRTRWCYLGHFTISHHKPFLPNGPLLDILLLH